MYTLQNLPYFLAALLFPALSFAQEVPTPTPQEIPVTGSLFADVLFYLLALITVGMAVLVVIRRNPLHGALALVVSFFSLAGIYVLLFAHFLAAIQILVYAGAIMVLFVFVIMLLNLNSRELGSMRGGLRKLPILGLLVFFTVSVLIFVKEGLDIILLPSGEVGKAEFLPPAPLNPGSFTSQTFLAEGYGSTGGIGEELFSRFLLPFELASILLLVAIVGAVAVAKKRI